MRHRRCFFTLAAVGAVVSLMAASAHAATITVTTRTDETSSDNHVSLREAIKSINAGADQFDVTHTGAYGTNDTVIVPASFSHYALSQGEIPLSKSITITGGGKAGTIVDASGGNMGQRIFRVTGTPTVSISGLTLSGANLPVVGGNGSRGGAVRLEGGNLTLTGVAVSGNTVNGGTSVSSPRANGGGIWQQAGTVTLINSTVSGNNATSATGADHFQSVGGGIGMDSGTLTLTNSAVTSNTAGTQDVGDGGAGGGLNLGAGTVSITGSTISGNTAAGGTLPPAGDTGGIGGGIDMYGGGVGMPLTVTISSTAFTNNTAAAGTQKDGFGGAIFNEAATVTLTNATFSADTAGGTGRSGWGGEIYTLAEASGEPAAANSLLNVTLVGGKATGAGHGGNLFEETGSQGSTTTLKNTLLSGGSAATGANCAGPMKSSGHNLEVGNSCGLGASGDQEGIADAKLGSFGGGPPAFYPLLAGSRAIDAGDKAACPATDERGIARPDDPVSACDIGAFEFQQAKPQPPACTVIPKGNKVLLRKPKGGKGKKGNQSVGTLTVSVKCDQAAQITLKGIFTAGKKKHRKSFNSQTVTAPVKAGIAKLLKVKLPKKALSALKAGKRESARFVLSASNANGTALANAKLGKVKGRR